MAEGTWQTHGTIIRAALQGNVDLDGSSSIKWMFSSATSAPNPDTEFQSGITNEVTGTNLPAGGVAATGASVTYTSASDTVTFTVDDLTVSDVTATGIRTVYLVDTSGGSAATNRIIASVLLDSALSPNAGALTMDIPADGVFAVTV